MSDTPASTTAPVQPSVAAQPVAAQPVAAQPVPKKGNGSTTIIIVIVVLLLLCICCIASIAIGVSRGLLSFSGYVQRAANDAISNEVNKGNDSSSVTSSTNGGDTSVSSTGNDNGFFSLTGNLPSGFPKDVPILPNSKVGFGASDKKDGKDQYTVSLTANKTPSEIASYFRSNLQSNGWKITAEQSLFGVSITAKKNDREFTVVILGDETKSNATSYTIVTE